MAKGLRQAAATSSIVAAANYVRGRTAAVLASRANDFGAPRIERNCLVEWFERQGLIRDSAYCRQFSPVSTGAEHCVYFDLENLRAIKATHPNRFGHSVSFEGAQATPSEYLRRLALHNIFFGDDIQLVGCIAGENGVEILTSQPWITAHPTLPAATNEQIDSYFSAIKFRRSTLFPSGAFFYSPFFDLAAADAHSGNVLVSDSGVIVAIDVVLGSPGPALSEKLRREMPE